MYLYTLKPINQRTKYYLLLPSIFIKLKKVPITPVKKLKATLKIAFLVERQISFVEIKTAVSGNVIVSVECDSFSI